MMNRRQFLGSTPMLTDALLQAVQPITHVDVSQNGALLKSSVVKGKELQPEGNSPGAKARVHFNGPTAQLAAVAAGVCTLEPGAQPHPPHRHPEEEFMIVAIGTGEIEVAGVVTQVGGGRHHVCRGQCVARHQKHGPDDDDVLLHENSREARVAESD